MERLDKASVTRLGEIHNKLGLEPRWYIGAATSPAFRSDERNRPRMPARPLDSDH
jgi:hypothetical protein